MDWLQPSVHPDSEALLRNIGLWPHQGKGGHDPQGLDGEGGVPAPRPLTDRDEERYWQDMRTAHGAMGEDGLQPPASGMSAPGGRFEYDSAPEVLPPHVSEWQRNKDLEGQLLQALDDLKSAEHREKALAQRNAMLEDMTQSSHSNASAVHQLREVVAKRDAEIDSLRAKLEDREAALGRTEAQLADTMKELTAAKETIRERDEVIEERDREVERLRGELSDAKQDIEGKKEEIERLTDTTVAQQGIIKAQLDKLEHAKQGGKKDPAVAQQLAASADLVERQTATIMELTKQVQAAQAEADDLRRPKGREVDGAVAEQQVKMLKANLSRSAETVSSLRDQLLEAQSELARQRAASGGWGAGREPETEQVRTLTADKRAMNERIIQLETELRAQMTLSRGGR